VLADIGAVVKAAAPFKPPFKVIVETGVLSEPEIVEAAKLVADSGATFIKTCTGFGGGRATVHDILLIRRTVGEKLKIKASGGVASLEDGLELLRAGADVLAFRGHLVRQLETLGWPDKA
jgi:deoxyribose-phosphate aldolase